MGVLERAAAAVEGCLSKLTHCETRLMHAKLKGHEFVRVWCQSIEDFDPNLDQVSPIVRQLRSIILKNLDSNFES